MLKKSSHRRMFNIFNYIRAIFGASRIRRQKNYNFSLKLFLVRTSTLVIFTILVVINHAFFLLDEILFFFYRRVKIVNPLLIIGLPRSGTTFLFRTLAADKTNFSTFTLGEILFAPSLIQKFLFYSLNRIDKLFGSPLKRIYINLESKNKFEYQKVHDYKLFKPEEDELLLLNLFATAILKYFFYDSTVFDKYLAFDEEVKTFEKRNILNFQKRCIKKHVFFWTCIHGQQKFFLSKNPLFCPKIDSMFKYDPELRLIVTNRELAEVIPSFISMNAAIIKTFHSTKEMYPEAASTQQLINAWDEQLWKKLKGKHRSQYFVCQYTDLTKDIRKMVNDIYTHFGIEMSEEFKTILHAKSREQALYRSKHNYDTVEIHKAISSS